MAKPLAGKIEIDDTRNGDFRSADARFGITDDKQAILTFELGDGRARTIKIPPNMVPMSTHTPPIIEAYTAEDHTGNGHRFGPFLSRLTAEAVAKGRGERGGDGRVATAKYVTWYADDGTMTGVMVLRQPVRLSAAAPGDAAVEAVLGTLSPEQRRVMEAALARR